MIRIYKTAEALRETLSARVQGGDISEVGARVAEIIKDVRAGGDDALRAYTERFDGARLDSLRVSEAELDAAVSAVEPDFLETLTIAKNNIEAFHKNQRREGFSMNGEDGIVLGQRILPLNRVGLYIPGGTASYPSTVLMNAIPARIAGVSEIVMTTPADRDGNVSPVILAAAKLLGITEIYKLGGAQAIAALAYGTASIRPVDKIVGPGNIYVATAKKQVFGKVDIDMIAGPSEILVIADKSANPRHIAADLLSQAEHDKLAAAVLLCTDISLAESVSAEIERQLRLLPREDIARTSIDNNGMIVLCDSVDSAIALANELAPEHLELCIREPFEKLDLVRNAGSVFLGGFAPEALGDYFAGPNHTLPTMGTARFQSPLGVDDFIKRSSYIYYTSDALAKVSRRVADFAEREGLTAHARSITSRFED